MILTRTCAKCAVDSCSICSARNAQNRIVILRHQVPPSSPIKTNRLTAYTSSNALAVMTIIRSGAPACSTAFSLVGFRALLHSDNHGVRLISRNGNTFKSFPALCEGLARDMNGRRCMLDGEIVCLDPHGKPQFRDLLFRRAEPLFYAFDILWDEHAKTDDDEENSRFRNGEDLRYMPPIDRKLRLHAVVPKSAERLLYCDHIDPDGEGLFRLPARTILKESWRSAKVIRTCLSTRLGSRFVITTTARLSSAARPWDKGGVDGRTRAARIKAGRSRARKTQ